MPRPDGLEVAGQVGLGHRREHREPVLVALPPPTTIWLVVKSMSWTRSRQHSPGAVTGWDMNRCAGGPRTRVPYSFRSGGVIPACSFTTESIRTRSAPVNLSGR
jgi:hypothetical protein